MITQAKRGRANPSQSTDDSSKAVYPSTCWECSVCCGSLLTVENQRVTEIAPNPEHPHSQGAFCIKRPPKSVRRRQRARLVVARRVPPKMCDSAQRRRRPTSGTRF
jgi:anaerobic selenocysteine-containing dehydrogenase